MAGGKLIVFSAPSGSGKTTIVQHLLKLEKLNLDFSISATSREPRKGEVHGQDYYFISLKQFKQHIKKEEFLEWEEVYRDNFYGTLKKEIERIWAWFFYTQRWEMGGKNQCQKLRQMPQRSDPAPSPEW